MGHERIDDRTIKIVRAFCQANPDATPTALREAKPDIQISNSTFYRVRSGIRTPKKKRTPVKKKPTANHTKKQPTKKKRRGQTKRTSRQQREAYIRMLQSQNAYLQWVAEGERHGWHDLYSADLDRRKRDERHAEKELGKLLDAQIKLEG